MVKFIKQNLGFLIFYLVLAGSLYIINLDLKGVDWSFNKVAKTGFFNK